MQLLTYAKPNQTTYATFLQWFVPLGWGATRPSGPVAYAATTHARLRLAWARGPAHVAHARGQYRHLRAVHTASALVSGLSLIWYYELRLDIRQNTTVWPIGLRGPG